MFNSRVKLAINKTKKDNFSKPKSQCADTADVAVQNTRMENLFISEGKDLRIWKIVAISTYHR
jgi:hypothetical protein